MARVVLSRCDACKRLNVGTSYITLQRGSFDVCGDCLEAIVDNCKLADGEFINALVRAADDAIKSETVELTVERTTPCSDCEGLKHLLREIVDDGFTVRTGLAARILARLKG